MGILSSIKEKIFGKPAAEPAKPELTASAAPINLPLITIPTPVLPESVDVEAILDAAVQAKGIKLNWRESIVDLMKALDLDSSLAARKELATDLNYTGAAADGSPEKNLWLHQALMKSLAENGGKVPQELLN